MTARRIPRVVGLFLSILATQGYAQPQWERVLIPVVAYLAPGAYGSLWSSELWGFNESSLYIPITANPNLPCALPEGCPGQPAQPHSAFSVDTLGVYPNGRFLFVGGGGLSKLHFTLRVYDTSRETLEYGTSVPVVSDNAFSNEPLPLVGISVAPTFRTTVRIFGLDNLSDRVRVKITRIDNPLVQEELNVQVDIAQQKNSDFGGGGGAVPSFGIISDLAGIIPAAMLTQGPSEPRFALEVEPNSQKLWAFVTITNNQTQRVTVISP